MPERFTSVRAFQLMEKAFPQEVTASNLVFVVERENESLTAADFVLIDGIIKDLEQLRLARPELKIGKIDSYRDELVGSRLTSTDRHCTLIQVCLGTPYLALATVREVLPDAAGRAGRGPAAAAPAAGELTRRAGWRTSTVHSILRGAIYRATK